MVIRMDMADKIIQKKPKWLRILEEFNCFEENKNVIGDKDGDTRDSDR